MKPVILDLNRAQLVVVDLQEKLLPVVHDGERVLREAGKLVRALSVLGVPVVCTEQYPKGLGPTHGDISCHFKEDVSRLEKVSFSCFGAQAYEDEVNRSQVILCGVESHICVMATALEHLRRGQEVVVAAQACGSRDPENHRMAMEALARAGAAVYPVETIVYHLVGKAGSAEFKAVQSILI